MRKRPPPTTETVHAHCCVAFSVKAWVCWQWWADVWWVQLTGDSRCRSSKEKVSMEPSVAWCFASAKHTLTHSSEKEGEPHKSFQSRLPSAHISYLTAVDAELLILLTLSRAGNSNNESNFPKPSVALHAPLKRNYCETEWSGLMFSNWRTCSVIL